MDNVSTIVTIVPNNDSTPLIKNDKISNGLSIWSSGESGYYTTPGNK